MLPQLAAEGIRILRRTKWNAAQKAWVRDYFFRELMPVLTPIGLDPSHPFPRLLNKSLNFVVELEGKDAFGRKSSMAIVQAPRVLPRVIALPRSIAGCEYGFMFLSSILHAHVGELFPGMSVLGCYQFQLTRNSDLYIDEEELRELKSLRKALQGELSQRQFGDSVRLEVADNCPRRLADALLQQFGLTEQDLYQVNGPVNLVRLMQIADKVDRPDLKFPAFIPGMPRDLTRFPSMFDCIRRSDILLHHPFQSFMPVINFIEQAANDPQVVAIKQTVYRTGAQSAMMELLMQAARNGKAVTVVVELMARFDEEANINWAQRLEEAGAHVIYGVVGHKTHCKMALVVRREGATAAALRASVHRQLPFAHRHALHRFRPVYLQRGDLRRRQRSVHAAHRARQGEQAEAPVAGAVHAAPAHHQGDPERGAQRRRRPQGAHHRAHERAARARDHRRALRGLAGRRGDRPHRARRLRAAPGADRACRKTSACARCSAAFSSTAACSTSTTTAPRTFTCRAPTGWTAISSAASRSAFRCSSRA